MIINSLIFPIKNFLINFIAFPLFIIKAPFDIYLYITDKTEIIFNMLFINFPSFVYDEIYSWYYPIIILHKLPALFDKWVCYSNPDYAFFTALRDNVSHYYLTEIFTKYRNICILMYDIMLLPFVCSYKTINPMNEQIPQMAKTIYLLKKYIFFENVEPEYNLWTWTNDYPPKDTFKQPTWRESASFFGEEGLKLLKTFGITEDLDDVDYQDEEPIFIEEETEENKIEKTYEEKLEEYKIYKAEEEERQKLKDKEREKLIEEEDEKNRANIVLWGPRKGK